MRKTASEPYFRVEVYEEFGCVCKASFLFFAVSSKKNTMADVDDNQEFETGDAGASKTYPAQASSVRKGGHIIIKNRPCKVVEMSTSKTGKHGHAKVNHVFRNV